MMRRLVLVAVAMMLVAGTARADRVRIAATTSFENSGLAAVLLPPLQTETGHDVELLVVGTGQAIRLGRAGDVDAVLVHARAAEDAFVRDGHASHRRPIMWNDFVVVGPAADPARVRGAVDAADALTRIAVAGSDFVSRGDDSGTHAAERAIWRRADLAPVGHWYKEVGAGMGAALNTAAGLGAYIFVDRASWLAFGRKGDLALLFEGDPALRNQYAFLPVSAARHPHVNAEAAAEVEAWLASPAAQRLIDGYGIGGEQLFHFNAEAAP